VKISLLHATYKRPEKALECYRAWRARAIDVSGLEYIFAVNATDGDTLEALHVANYPGNLVIGDFKGSAPAWNQAARLSSGEWLVQVSDDFVPPDGWDEWLRGRTNECPTVVAVADGFRKDSLITMAICNRAYYELEGYFLHPMYRSVFSDDHFTYRALKRAKIGTALLLDCRDVVFRHEHHYHVPDQVPMDETYARQNAPEAYAEGAKIFAAMNPEAEASGLIDWRK
jgi:hypothetical protein